MKLKQGWGRGIRTERDTCAIAICDIRVGKDGAYRECVLTSLPDCEITDDKSAVARFFSAVKSEEYFK